MTRGRRTPRGGSTGSPTAPTRSTTSRSCRSPRPSWPAPTRVLDVGCGDGQISRLAAGLDGVELVVGVDPTWNQISVAAERGRRRRVRPRGCRPRCRSPTARSTPSSPASCSSTSTTSTRRSPRSPGCSQPGGRFCFFLNHPLLQTPDSGWIDDQVLDPPEQYWRIGPYLIEDRDDRGGREGRVHPLHPPPAQPLRQRPRRATACSSSGWSSRRRRPGSSPWRRSTREAATIPRLLYLRTRQDRPLT